MDSLNRTVDYLASVGWNDVPTRALLIADGIFKKAGYCDAAKSTIRRVVVTAVAAARGRAAAKARLADRRKASPPKTQQGPLLPIGSSSCDEDVSVATVECSILGNDEVFFRKCIMDAEQTTVDEHRLALPSPSTEGIQAPSTLGKGALPRESDRRPSAHEVPVHSSEFTTRVMTAPFSSMGPKAIHTRSASM